MSKNNRNDLAQILRQRRAMKGLSIIELSKMSGVSSSHISRIEAGERFPSARILGKIARPLGFDEVELLTLAGYLSSQPSPRSEVFSPRLDPLVVRVLSREPPEVQRSVIKVLRILKNISGLL